MNVELNLNQGAKRDMEYLTTAELAERWKITSRRIGILCADGRIEGVIKKGKTWLIPADSPKPPDKRFKPKNTNSFPQKTGKEAET